MSLERARQLLAESSKVETYHMMAGNRYGPNPTSSDYRDADGRAQARRMALIVEAQIETVEAMRSCTCAVGAGSVDDCKVHQRDAS